MKTTARTLKALLILAITTLATTSTLPANELDEADATTEAPDTPTPPSPTPPGVSQKIQRENLITNPPFRIIRRPRVQQPGTVQQPLEIRGFAGIGDNLEISLTNPATRECHWVKIRDEDAKWYVESADPVTRIATVRMNGISMALEMAKASEAPTPITPALAPAPGRVIGTTPTAGPGPGPGGAPGIRNPQPGNWRTTNAPPNTVQSGENYPNPRTRGYGNNPNTGGTNTRRR